jgi:pimeloyl-ACP methyl ester carboxylesterase
MVRLATSRAAPVLGLLPGKRLIVERSLRQVFHDPALVTPERLSEYLAAAKRSGSATSLWSLGVSLGARPARVAEALPGITAPTLVVWGDDDGWIPPSHADRFVAAIAGARKVVIPACGHLPQEERPAELARLLLSFLGERWPGSFTRPLDLPSE